MDLFIREKNYSQEDLDRLRIYVAKNLPRAIESEDSEFINQVAFYTGYSTFTEELIEYGPTDSAMKDPFPYEEYGDLLNAVRDCRRIVCLEIAKLPFESLSKLNSLLKDSNARLKKYENHEDQLEFCTQTAGRIEWLVIVKNTYSMDEVATAVDEFFSKFNWLDEKPIKAGLKGYYLGMLMLTDKRVIQYVNECLSESENKLKPLTEI